MDEKAEKVAKSTLMIRSQFAAKNGLGKLEKGEVAEADELIAVHRFLVPPAKVGFSVGLTLNMGNYESARIEVSVEVPCYKEEIDEAYEYAKHMCSTRLQEEVQSVRTSGKPFPF